jgi:hypothetical protein
MALESSERKPRDSLSVYQYMEDLASTLPIFNKGWQHVFGAAVVDCHEVERVLRCSLQSWPSQLPQRQAARDNRWDSGGILLGTWTHHVSR